MNILTATTEVLKKATVCSSCQRLLKKGNQSIRFQLNYKGLRLAPRMCKVCGIDTMSQIQKNMLAANEEMRKINNGTPQNHML